MNLNGFLILGWSGTLFQIAGASFLAARLVAPRTAYWVMLMGSVIWTALALRTWDAPLATLMSAYTVINLLGIVLWHERKETSK